MSEYYQHRHLTDFGAVGAAAPEVSRKFFDFYAEAFKDGALSEREKALIALAVAHTVQCPYCIEAYTNESLAKGADLPQMTEAVFVATAIRGGATLVHGMQMLDVAKAKGMG
jgi:alkylhydroperoxidase/carboxymuconolactone decarboxylase family protein